MRAGKCFPGLIYANEIHVFIFIFDSNTELTLYINEYTGFGDTAGYGIARSTRSVQVLHQLTYIYMQMHVN